MDEQERRRLGQLWAAALYRALPGGDNLEPPAFVSEARAELARLIDDVQKNRNRPEELP